MGTRTSQAEYPQNHYDKMGLFSNLLFCADFGNIFYQQKYQAEKEKQYCYICGSYKKGTTTCTVQFIHIGLLKTGVTINL